MWKLYMHRNFQKYVTRVSNNFTYNIMSWLLNFNLLLCLTYKVRFIRGTRKKSIGDLVLRATGNYSTEQTARYSSFGPVILLLRTYHKARPRRRLANIQKAMVAPVHSSLLPVFQLNLHQQKQTISHHNEVKTRSSHIFRWVTGVL